MALTITKNTSVGELSIQNQLSSSQPSRMVLFSLAFDASYPAGGESFLPSQLGLKTIEHMQFNMARDDVAETARVCVYDAAAEKIVVYQQTDPADAGGADIPFPEVGAAVDLSDLDVTGWAIGSV